MHLNLRYSPFSLCYSTHSLRDLVDWQRALTYCQLLAIKVNHFFFLKKLKRYFYLLLLYYSKKLALRRENNGISLFNYSRDPKIMDFFRRYYPYLVSNPLCLANLLQRQLTSCFLILFSSVSVNSGRT